MHESQLRARAGLRLGRGRWLVPPWIAPAFAFCALVLLPWAAFLIFTLPRNYTANHWRVAWGGFVPGPRPAVGPTPGAPAPRPPLAAVGGAGTGPPPRPLPRVVGLPPNPTGGEGGGGA